MHRIGPKILFILLTLFIQIHLPIYAQPDVANDPGWPRVYENNGRRLIIYQPQIDFWKNYATIQFRCAIAVKDGVTAEERYGVMEVVAATDVDYDSREVAAYSARRDIRFANLTETEAARLRDIVNELFPQRQTTIVSLDRVLAYLDQNKQAKQKAVEVNLQPPKIFYSSEPAILLMFMGQPEFKAGCGKSDRPHVCGQCELGSAL